ncbi:MAG: bifunctional [glutamate--ammonia ligase]-adenylyl-L-tyrosine phosphorylase/[glutamate--ammonia-ligase] adenylyltransferase, partial [Thiohalomonadaceae bacterium]
MNDFSLPSSELAALPPLLRDSSERHWRRFAEAGGGVPDALLSEAVRVFACSHFVAEACGRHPDLLTDLITSGDLERSHDHGRYATALSARLETVSGETDLFQVLRRFRRREMVRIAWRDLAGRAGLAETLADLSALADACVNGALDWLYRDHTAIWGTPVDEDGIPQRMVVFGMGKLGGRELNFSSDIDLIFCYPGEGETRGGRRSVAHQEFFVRLGQRLINALDRTTVDGFVFRVDMRLRPFGEAAALAISFDAMEEYYQTHGREWERYALIKARPVAGDLAAGERLLAALRPFVYRRYVDYGAFESLRDMKALIEQEVRRKGMAHNIKLGAGGIREVEFIGQAFQLIRGGRDPGLQQRSILPVLDAVRERQLLPGYVVDELAEAYVLLRNVENRIQMVADEQRHTLPEGEEERARLAYALGFTEWTSFDAALSASRRRVHEHFEQVFAAPQNQASAQGSEDLAALWLGTLDEPQAMAVLENRGYQAPNEALRLITLTRESHALRNLSERGHGRLDRLMPLLIAAVGKRRDPDRTLQHVLRLVEAIARRTAYLALLVENPMALSQLVQLCSASSWIAALLTRHPVLLDELLDPRSLYYPPRRDAMHAELAERLAGVAPDDEEQQLEVLRQFKQVNTLRVAAADVAEAVPLMVVSDHLTELAETILAAAIQLAWRHLAAR